MSSDIALNFDAEAWTLKRTKEERALLTQVRNHDTDPATASEAAAELLRWYVRFGRMDAPEVQEAIEGGISAVMLKVARAALEVKPGARTDVTSLDFFQFPRKVVRGGGPKKAGVKQKLLELRDAYGDHLREQDVRLVLTTSGGNSLPRDKWPATVGQIENALTAHLAEVYSDVPPQQRREFVRASISLPWDTPKQGVAYPAHW